MLGFLGGNCTHHQRWRHPTSLLVLAVFFDGTPKSNCRGLQPCHTVAVNVWQPLSPGIIAAKKFPCSRRLWCRAAVPASVRLVAAQCPVV